MSKPPSEAGIAPSQASYGTVLNAFAQKGEMVDVFTWLERMAELHMYIL